MLAGEAALLGGDAAAARAHSAEARRLAQRAGSARQLTSARSLEARVAASLGASAAAARACEELLESAEAPAQVAELRTLLSTALSLKLMPRCPTSPEAKCP